MNDSTRLRRIIAAYEKTSLEHDVAYEDFVDVVVAVRQELFFEERDARAAADACPCTTASDTRWCPECPHRGHNASPCRFPSIMLSAR